MLILWLVCSLIGCRRPRGGFVFFSRTVLLSGFLF